jgi:hypothetical protein
VGGGGGRVEEEVDVLGGLDAETDMVGWLGCREERRKREADEEKTVLLLFFTSRQLVMVGTFAEHTDVKCWREE